MAGNGSDLGFYALPVIPSFEGGGAEVDKGMSRILGKLGDLGKKSGVSLGKGIGDGLASAEADVKRTTAAFEKFRDKAADAAGKVRVEEERLNKARAGGKTDQIVAAEERLEKARRDASRASADAEQASERLVKARQAEERATRSAADMTSKLGKLGRVGSSEFVTGLQQGIGGARDVGQQAADGFSGGFGGAAALMRLGSAAGPVGVALMGLTAVGVAAGKVLGPAIAEGMETQRVRDIVQAQLGVDDEQIRQLGEGVGRAYVEGFGSSVLDNYQTAKVALRSGLFDPSATDAQVAEITSKLQGLVTVTEASGAELARSITTLMRTGLAGGISEASDIITAGFQKGLDVSGDWLDTVNEYSTQARKFGLDASEYMTLLSQGLKGGARDTDKVADALKEFAIRAVDGSKTTREGFEALGLDADDMAKRFAAGGDSAKVALKATFDALKRVDDPMQQALTWQRLFGTQFEDMGDAVNKFDLTPAANEFRDLQGVSERSTKQASDNFKSNWETATRAVEQRFADLKTSLANWATDLPLIRDLPDMLRALADPHYNDIKAPSWAQPGTPLTPSGLLDTLGGGAGGQVPQSLADMLSGGVGGTLLPAPPDAPVAGVATPILTDAQADALGGTKAKPPRLFPNGLPSGSPRMDALAAFAGSPYGLPAGTDTGGYGSSGSVFPGWVHALEQLFGVKASTYSGHQESDRNEAGYAANPSHENRGIDWSGPVDAMQRFADYLSRIPGALEQVIWKNPNTGASTEIAGGRPQPGYFAADLAGHQNHVHTRQSAPIPLPGQAAAATVVPLGDYATSVPIDLSANTADRRLMALAGPSQGTPGFDENGRAGYWQADPKTVREADQRAADAMARIVDADNAVALAMARLNELDADAAESQQLSAQESLRKAQEDAQRARREAADAQADADEAKKGKFTAAKEAEKRKGSGEFDDLGGIFGSFLKETLGLDGSLFPDISDLPAVKALGDVMGFASPLMKRAAQGTLGIQQPGWTPEMGDPMAGMVDTAGGTSGLPFGMIPGISSLLPSTTTDPASTIHGAAGGGQPGPVDQSTHVTVNANDESANSIARAAMHAVQNPPRINTYSAPAQMLL